MEYADLVVRYVPNYGFMPIFKVGTVEYGRGSFYKSAEDALDVAIGFMEEFKREHPHETTA